MSSMVDTNAPDWTGRQWGWLVMVTAMAALLLLALLAPGWLAIVVAGLVVLVLSQFTCLTVTVTPRTLRAAFGAGLIRREIPLDEVESFQAVRNAWYWGWGIRFYPGGRLYNIAGLDAVELILRGGKRVRIGTDRPAELVRALERSTGRAALGPRDAPPPPPRSAVRLYRSLVGLAALIPALLLALFSLEERDPRVALGSSSFSVSSFMYRAEVDFDAVRELALVESLPHVTARTNGYALGATLRGHFSSDQGRLRLFVEADQPPFVRVTLPTGRLLFNLPDADRTRDLYERLQQALAAHER